MKPALTANERKELETTMMHGGLCVYWQTRQGQGSMGVILRSLVKKGYLTCEKHYEYPRYSEYQITDKGRQILEQLAAIEKLNKWNASVGGRK